jgi:hypothetical protein
VVEGPFTFEVIEMDGRRVKTIRLHVASEEGSTPEGAAAAKPE